MDFRRTVYLAVGLAVWSGVGSARAQDATRGDRVYIAAGSEFRYAVREAPLPVRQLGVIAVSALDSLRDPSTAEVGS